MLQDDDALEYTGEYGELWTFCFIDFVDSTQEQDNPKRREHYEERMRVHRYCLIASDGYMCLCRWLIETGYLGLYVAF